MTTFKKELPYLLIAFAPFLYLTYLWNKLPQKVPMHMQLDGTVDRWGNKSELIFMLFMMVGVTYLIFMFLPKLDPKQKLQEMGGKLHSFRMIFSLFISVLAIYILYSVYNVNAKPSLVFSLIGLLFVFLGNYMKTVRQNYFIGIKTPWTLENEEVWNKTHLLGGKMWFVGGILMTLTFLLNSNLQFYFFIGITVIITIVPTVYSYILYKKL